MVTDLTLACQHVYKPSFFKLREMIPYQVLDISDAYRTLNPYWALYMFSENEKETEKYETKMIQRMDAIKSFKDLMILYVESIYVRDDCRNRGICRMLLDLLRKEWGNQILWVNMEPTCGAELVYEYSMLTNYTQSVLGQLNVNASMAEHLGFVVDPDTWHRKIETVDADGNVGVETMLVRKCAYYLPDFIREMIKDDGELVALGRAKQKVAQHNLQK